MEMGSDGAELPYLEETQASQGAASFSGTHCDVRDHEPAPPMASWVLQPPAPAPPSGRSGSQPPAVVDDYQIFHDDDPEEYQALDRPGDFDRGQPRLDGPVVGEAQLSTPRRWWLAEIGALDEFLRHPLVFILASLGLIITPVITSLLTWPQPSALRPLLCGATLFMWARQSWLWEWQQLHWSGGS